MAPFGGWLASLSALAGALRFPMGRAQEYIALAPWLGWMCLGLVSGQFFELKGAILQAFWSFLEQIAASHRLSAA